LFNYLILLNKDSKFILINIFNIVKKNSNIIESNKILLSKKALVIIQRIKL